MLSVRGDGGASVSGASTKLTVPSSRHEGGLLPRKQLSLMKTGLGKHSVEQHYKDSSWLQRFKVP